MLVFISFFMKSTKTSFLSVIVEFVWLKPANMTSLQRFGKSAEKIFNSLHLVSSKHLILFDTNMFNRF